MQKIVIVDPPLSWRALRRIVSDIRQAGYDGRLREVPNKVSGTSWRLEVRLGKSKRCIGTLVPADESMHPRFIKATLAYAREQMIKLNQGNIEEVGTQHAISADSVQQVEVLETKKAPRTN